MCVEDVYMWRMRGVGVEVVWVWRVFGCGGCMGVEGVCVCESLCAYTWKHLLMRNGVDVCVCRGKMICAQTTVCRWGRRKSS